MWCFCGHLLALMPPISRREGAFVAKNLRLDNARFGNSAAPRRSPGALLSRSALGGCLLAAVVLASPQAFAAIKTVTFNAVRPDDGDLLNFRIAYDDAALIPSAVSALCGPDPTPAPGTTPPPSSGCYMQNTSNRYLPGPVAPSFQGYEIVKVTGTYYDKVENKTFNEPGCSASRDRPLRTVPGREQHCYKALQQFAGHRAEANCH